MFVLNYGIGLLRHCVKDKPPAFGPTLTLAVKDIIDLDTI